MCIPTSVYGDFLGEVLLGTWFGQDFKQAVCVCVLCMCVYYVCDIAFSLTF